MPGFVDPSKDQLKAFFGSDEAGPIWMLNLIRYRKKAKYEDGAAATGAQAYDAYLKAAGEFLAAVGGKMIWSGEPRHIVIGPEDEQWDKCFVIEYPSVAAFGAMIKNPGYQAIVHHRTAAVKESRLIHLRPSGLK